MPGSIHRWRLWCPLQLPLTAGADAGVDVALRRPPAMVRLLRPIQLAQPIRFRSPIQTMLKPQGLVADAAPEVLAVQPVRAEVEGLPSKMRRRLLH